MKSFYELEEYALCERCAYYVKKEGIEYLIDELNKKKCGVCIRDWKCHWVFIFNDGHSCQRIMLIQLKEMIHVIRKQL